MNREILTKLKELENIVEKRFCWSSESYRIKRCMLHQIKFERSQWLLHELLKEKEVEKYGIC